MNNQKLSNQVSTKSDAPKARQPGGYGQGRPKQEQDFEETVIKVNRVSKKTKGGNTIGFSVLTVVGDKKGQVGIGLGKGPDVASSIRKSITYAKKHQITVPMKGTTIPHKVIYKFGAAKIMLKPAPEGAGVIAGGAVRSVLAAAGIRDIVAKMLGSRNAITNVYCVYEALQNLKTKAKQGTAKAQNLEKTQKKNEKKR